MKTTHLGQVVDIKDHNTVAQKVVIRVPREVEMILANGKCHPVSNPFHIYFRWGEAMVEIKPYGDMSGHPEPKVFRRMSGKKKRHCNIVIRKQ